MHLKHKLILVLTVLALQGFAQRDSLRKLHPIYVSANIGVSIPLGFYGRDSVSGNPPEGCAVIGINYNILAGIAIAEQTAEFQVLLSHTSNPFNINIFFEGYNYWTGNTFSQVGPLGARYEFTSAMAGFARTYMGEHFSFDMRFLAGYMVGGIPQVSYYQTNEWWYPGKATLMTIDQSEYDSFVFDLGIGFKIFVSPKLFISANIDMALASSISSSSADYSNYILSPTNTITVKFNNPVRVSDVYPYHDITSVAIPYSIPPPAQMNMCLGLGYAFPYQKKG